MDRPQIRPVGPNSSWREDVERVRPTVLVLGGFLTAPFVYAGLVDRLRARGVAGAVVSQVWLPDWLLATSRGLAAVTSRGGRAFRAASTLSAERSGGAPLLVIGHSAGGMIARLLTAPEPFAGRRYGASRMTGAIVTLGTPHGVAPDAAIGRRIHLAYASIADALVPGPYWQPEVGYLSVASRAVVGDPRGRVRARIAYQFYRSICGPDVAPGTEGDGLVPARSALLPGARGVMLDQASHGPTTRPWYGSDEVIDAWWPLALETWRDALRYRARIASDAQAGDGGDNPAMRRVG